MKKANQLSKANPNATKNVCSKWGGGALTAFLNKRKGVVLLALLLCVSVMGIANAGGAPASGADAMWSTITGLIGTWVTRLGGVVMFVGGIMFGLGWKSDDAEQKSRGISTVVSGAIVTALAALIGTFFA